MDAPGITAGQAVFDLQLLRRRMLALQDFPLWPPDLKLQVKQAEERLKAVSGLDLAVALIDFGRSTGQRVKV